MMELTSPFRIVMIVGTRPDALKMYPIYRELTRREIDVVLISTTQHSDLLEQVFDELDFHPDHHLDVMVEDQDLSHLTGRLAFRLDEALRKFSPDLVLVQGDTTSSMVGALVSFYQKVPVNHVEAGLRTGDPYRPFPEEVNRKIIGHIADFHFAPTQRARRNLIGEGIDPGRVLVTGNTAIDTLLEIREKAPVIRDDTLRTVLDEDTVLIAVTAHRRESFGKPMSELASALGEITSSFNGIRIVYPVHPNPSVRGPIFEALSGMEGIVLTDPLSYGDLVQLLVASWLILTDSGGIQEEAPSLGKPVLVLREKTERVESIDLGIARLIGMDHERIVRAVSELMLSEEEYTKMVPVENPYGDGRSAERIVESIMNRYLEVKKVPQEFQVSGTFEDGTQDG
jgi:UDP-N-acetylglucosamine 2-epimerase (non-hydrolysing)